MSKTVLRLACLVFVMVLCLGPFPHSYTFLANSRNDSNVANSQSFTVEVTFDGLMVFRRVRGEQGQNDHYEVGILDQATAPDHDFWITLDNKPLITSQTTSQAPRKTLQGKWNLHVLTAAGDKKPIDIKPRDVKPCRRLEDTVDPEDLAHTFDFCWIIDLEKEFHGGQPFKLRPNKLKPIILLNNGQLYAKYKYDELQREKQPNGDWADFGFVAETIALSVDLQSGESLVLIDDGGQPLFILKPGGPQNAAIYNAPPSRMLHRQMKKNGRCHDSHFPYYYNLFDNMSADEKIDICPKERGIRPLNRWVESNAANPTANDQLRKDTFDHQACGAVLLGRSSDALH